MSESRTYQTEAVILKKTKLREADLILTMYTPEFGKIQGVAKGVRKTKSRMAGHLELLTHSQISLTRGRNLDTITASQTVNSFMPLKSDLWLSSCALYCTELVNQFAEENLEDERVFRLLLETLKQLCDAPNKELVLHYYELHLLIEVGYGPQLRECVICHAPLTPVVNYFCAPVGGMVCPNCAAAQIGVHPLSINAQKVLRFFQDAGWEKANHLKIDADLCHEIERVMNIYLEYLLERNVKSADWLRSLREMRLKPVAVPPPRPLSSAPPATPTETIP